MQKTTNTSLIITMISISIFLVVALVGSVTATPSFIRDIKFPDDRIVGGEDIDIDRVPWQVSVQWENKYLCGGSIVAPKWVVTSALCTYGVETTTHYTVRAGTSIVEHEGQVIKLAKMYQHPNYNSSTKEYDISLLELVSPLTFSGNVSAIDLPAAGSILDPGTPVLVTGWGYTSEDTDVYPVANLKGVNVEIVSWTTCSDAYSGIQATITDVMLCAGVSGGGKDSCIGDTGGPLVSGNVLVGIVSWGNGCGRDGFPRVYASVSALRDYITEVTGL